MVFVKTTENETLVFDLDPVFTSLETLNLSIEEKSGIPVSLQRLYFSSKPLLTSKSATLSDLGIQFDSTITLHLPLLGAMQPRISPRTEAFLNHRAANPQITKFLADLKRKFDEVPEIIPEFTRPSSSKNKKMKNRCVLAVSENSGQAAQPHVTTTSGTSQMPATTTATQGKGTVLSLKLDGLSDSLSGLTLVDAKGYITEINITSITEISKARLFLTTVTQTNPKHPPGWIAAAKLEELAGDIQAARQFIDKGCEECPESEDMWLEAFRLATPLQANTVISCAINAIPKSLKLWMLLVNMIEDNMDKITAFWRALNEIPDSLELWLAFAKVRTYEDAKNLLNEARWKLPKEPAIWIAAAMLEEANGKSDVVGKIIEGGIRCLRRQGLEIDREVWMKEAEAAARAGSVATCQAIIRNTIGIGVEDIDAEECRSALALKVDKARNWFHRALTLVSDIGDLWAIYYKFELEHGNEDTQKDVLQRCKAADPKHGERWEAISKAMENSYPSTESILKKTVLALAKEESAADGAS